MIGIFDSGQGGLTVMRAVRDVLPDSDIVYFGDTKNAPYGSRTRAELSRLTVAGFRTLLSNGATTLVSACNSVSAALALALLDVSALPAGALVEMVGPTVRHVVRSSPGRTLLIATPATVNSGLYQDAFAMLEMGITERAIPELAGAIERGADEGELEQIIRTALPESVLADFDTLVLACTHYPLIAPLFERVVGERVHLVNPAHAVAHELEKHFWPREAGFGQTKFLISADSPHFRAQVARLFPESKEAIEVLE